MSLPPIETRTPTSRKTYPLMTKDLERTHQYFKRSRPNQSEWNGDFHHQQQQQPQVQQQQQQQQQQQHQRHYSSIPQTYYEQRCDKNEVVFGAVQEQDGCCEAMVIKAVDYGYPIYNNPIIHRRISLVGTNQNGGDGGELVVQGVERCEECEIVVGGCSPVQGGRISSAASARTGSGGGRHGKFHYDPLSYALNFDDGPGQNGNLDEDYAFP
ncbi:hypothetical protein F0562_004665 [Nyssa sinensis]|uniref:Uncharacterized protein n=1 Tax=Nyssa sinensis TaxID=561372 RepID=A0A5J5BZL3_9ASTE|nr:hypothetical protein F0562_004665 [Nyssa sinensis]